MITEFQKILFLFQCICNSPEVWNFLSIFFCFPPKILLSKNCDFCLELLFSSRIFWISSKMFILVSSKNFVLFCSQNVWFPSEIFGFLLRHFCFPSKIFDFVLKFLFWFPFKIFILVSFQIFGLLLIFLF